MPVLVLLLPTVVVLFWHCLLTLMTFPRVFPVAPSFVRLFTLRPSHRRIFTSAQKCRQ